MAAFTIPKTMKALVKKKEDESYSYENIPVPEPKEGEVLLKVDSVAICGSDIALYKWDATARVIATVPFVPGHECAGTVVKCGPGVNGVAVGDRVGVENHFFCGECFQCKHENGAICSRMGQFGHGRKTESGGCSEYTCVPAQYLYVVKSGLDAEQIALLEPLGVAHNAIERLAVEGQDVLVTGCGPVGILAQSVAKALGARRVIATDIEDKKLELAKQMGADIAVNTKKQDLKEFVMKLTDGVGMDRICECTGVSFVVNATFSMLRKGGHLCLVGMPKQPLHVENVLQDVLFKALTMRTVHGRLIFHTWQETEKLVADGKVDVKKIVSHRVPMSRFEEAFQVLFSGEACKILLDPTQ
ncbi:L-threonine 3-dehydrogenase-like [Babylonia areolata]|uniref:L-threonine 3-dehydrogenase-like n=1 Tax=Babylonia areolata TaxID=304850 RepID=UPI003FD08987